MGELAGGVSVVTTGRAPNRSGYTGTAVFSLSVNPERIVISIGRESVVVPLLGEHGLFGLNVLSADQQHVADRFAGRGGVKGEERYQGAQWTVSPRGVSLLVNAYAMIDRITQDKTPLITVNHGRTDSTDGRVFPCVFPLLLNPYRETSGIVKYISSRIGAGGLDNLKGKKIVVLYHGSPYGNETIPIYELLAQKYGFDVQQIEVPHPGVERQSQWLTIRRPHLDYVVLRGWGVMNPVALKTAAKVGFPADHIVGNVWSNLEEDVLPAGDAAIGYTAITTQASGEQYPVVQEIVKTVYGAGKGNLDDKSRIGSVYRNLGTVNGILNVEAVRIAQETFGHRTLTGDEVRWAFEDLQLDLARVEALGAKDLFHSINATWGNHEDDGYVTFQRWDGKKWNVVSDWIVPDWALLRPIIEKSSEAYAKEKGLPIRMSENTPAAN
jgi:branched-chain amino acid transport system substrate-binding protein